MKLTLGHIVMTHCYCPTLSPSKRTFKK